MAKYRFDKDEMREALCLMDIDIIEQIDRSLMQGWNSPSFRDLYGEMKVKHTDSVREWLVERLLNEFAPNALEEKIRDLGWTQSEEAAVYDAFFEVWNERDKKHSDDF